MNSHQFQASYLIECLVEAIQNKIGYPDGKVLLDLLLKPLAWFDIESTINFKSAISEPDPSLSVLNNILCRGLPTRMSLDLEQRFVNTFQYAKKKSSYGTISYELFDKTDLNYQIFRALHIIEPRVTIKKNSYGQKCSSFEKDFLFNQIDDLNNFLLQILEPQRELDSIIKPPYNFSRQRADFTLELPYSNSKNGHLIEIDGPHHAAKVSQQILDQNRDVAVNNSKWQVHRITNSKDSPGTIEKLVQEQYVQTLSSNFQNKQFDTNRLTGLQLALSPVAIARIQKVLLELLIKGVLKISSPKWKIVIYERDVPCAHWAIEDLRSQLFNVFQLAGKEVQLPEIELLIITTPEFKSCAINEGINTIFVSEVPSSYSCDVLIDISMLMRSKVQKYQLPDIRYQHSIAIRSSHHVHTKRKFYTSDLINYGEIAESPSKQQALHYFLQSVFRKEQFRAGQLEILNRALQVQSVIGLLPTGGGKSLTYQLAVLLQPGVSLVVDPLKSLMKDQVHNLIKNRVDACVFINSSIKTPEERNRIIARMKNGEALFTFISPERLQIQEFRDALSAMYKEKVYFNYCVIDEAHCVSEWGHDFRTSYLRLGENALKHCKPKNLAFLPLFGLTATASFDVLADVQRELSTLGQRLGEDAIVRSENVNRPELTFHIRNAKIAVDSNENEWTIKKKVSSEKKRLLNGLFEELEKAELITEDMKSGGLIFCPHTQGLFGVTDRYKKDKDGNPVTQRQGIADNLPEIPHLKVGIFRGANDDDTELQAEMEEEMMKNQTNFIENRLNLLVATKAFGMGIDKPNIRYTVHINYPNSLESYVQEAGRAGRDGKQAHCVILFNDQQVRHKNGVTEVDKDHLLFFHKNSFKGPDPEKEILHCLLQSISRGTKTTELSDLIAERLELEVKVSMWQSRTGAWYITISRAFKEDYLNIGLVNQAVYTDKTVDYSTAMRIKPIALEFLNSKPRGTDLVRWLTTETVEKGLEERLKDIKTGKSTELTIGFRNKWKIGGGELIADKQDTEKAIYRLSTIGVIDDYTVDYNAKTFTLYSIKKTKDEYTLHLKNYIRQYYSETRTNQEIQNFEKTLTRTGSPLKSLLNYLVDFVYREIEKKRRLAIDVMKEACYKGLEENGSQKFSEFLDMYFNSKYARPDYTVDGRNKSLSDRTSQGVEQNIDWVWEFMEIVNIDKSGGQINNLKHLRGACTRLLVTAPDNFTLLLLRAFSLFILEIDNPNPKLLDEGKSDLVKGFGLLSAQVDETEWEQHVRKFKKLLLQNSSDPRLETMIDELLSSLGSKELLNNYNDLLIALKSLNQTLSHNDYV